MSSDDTSPDGLDYWAWTVIANARDWLLNDPQALEWQDAARRWRDAFHATLDAAAPALSDSECDRLQQAIEEET